MRIHDVILIAQLKPTTNSILNLYERRLLSLLLIILNGEDEVKRLIHKRTRFIGRSKNKITEYLIR